MNAEMIEKAKVYAIEKHKNQKYGEGMPYTVHLEAVVCNLAALKELINAEYLGDFYESCIVIAWLHDVVEDTKTSIAEIEKEFGWEIAKCLEILSRPKDKTYYDYIMKILDSGDECMLVKHADLTANIFASMDLNDSYSRQKREKYMLARELIEKELFYDRGLRL